MSAIEGLRVLHKKAPFLFLNGNTFCEIARELVMTYSASAVRSEVKLLSIVGHHVAGKQLLTLDELKELLGEA